MVPGYSGGSSPRLRARIGRLRSACLMETRTSPLGKSSPFATLLLSCQFYRFPRFWMIHPSRCHPYLFRLIAKNSRSAIHPSSSSSLVQDLPSHPIKPPHALAPPSAASLLPLINRAAAAMALSPPSLLLLLLLFAVSYPLRPSPSLVSDPRNYVMHLPSPPLRVSLHLIAGRGRVGGPQSSSIATTLTRHPSPPPTLLLHPSLSFCLTGPLLSCCRA